MMDERFYQLPIKVDYKCLSAIFLFFGGKSYEL